MNKPMTDDRLDKLVRMVECGEWERLVDEWCRAGAPFGFLGDKCGCPSQVRHGTSANLAAEDLQALRADPLIIDMSGDLETLRVNNARKVVFQRYEHYQRLVTS